MQRILDQAVLHKGSISIETPRKAPLNRAEESEGFRIGVDARHGHGKKPSQVSVIICGVDHDQARRRKLGAPPCIRSARAVNIGDVIAKEGRAIVLEVRKPDRELSAARIDAELETIGDKRPTGKGALECFLPACCGRKRFRCALLSRFLIGSAAEADFAKVLLELAKCFIPIETPLERKSGGISQHFQRLNKSRKGACASGRISLF
jgi:hypothetical protein